MERVRKCCFTELVTVALVLTMVEERECLRMVGLLDGYKLENKDIVDMIGVALQLVWVGEVSI